MLLHLLQVERERLLRKHSKVTAVDSTVSLQLNSRVLALLAMPAVQLDNASSSSSCWLLIG
jgi:hypothetical protein